MVYIKISENISEINRKWHDQPLEIGSIIFDEKRDELKFNILQREDKAKKIFEIPFLLSVTNHSLNKKQIVLTGIKSYVLEIEKNEVELLVNEVSLERGFSVIEGMNGRLKLVGDMVYMMEVADKGIAFNEISVFFIFFEFTWKRKMKA